MSELNSSKAVLIRSYGKSELASLYLINWRTLKRWIGIENVIKLDLNSKKKILKPNTVKKIFKIVGKP